MNSINLKETPIARKRKVYKKVNDILLKLVKGNTEEASIHKMLVDMELYGVSEILVYKDMVFSLVTEGFIGLKPMDVIVIREPNLGTVYGGKDGKEYDIFKVNKITTTIDGIPIASIEEYKGDNL